MTYQNKVKRASKIYNAIIGLSAEQSISIVYKGDTYRITARKGYRAGMSYSVWRSFSGMNVDRLGKTSMTLYTYDMMSQKTTYRLSLLDCVLVPEKELVAA